MDIKERFNLLINYYTNGNKRDFSSKAGISATVIENIVGTRQGNPSFEILQKILYAFADINSDWLLTGKGEMLKSDISTFGQRKLIPVYDASTIGGINERIANIDSVSQPEEWIDAGEWFSEATAAIHHYGDSMIEYPSGCILALKHINDLQKIIWGKNYVVETDEYRITKRLQKGLSEEYVRAYSTNEETYQDGTLIHQPMDILLNSIIRLELVLGYVVKEQSSGKIYNIINRRT
jgi:hypothetical protein